MASVVYLHIGLPKTGTTYLQSVLWDSRRDLARDGVLLPGRGHREHLWAALELTGRTHLERRHERAPGTLARLVEAIRRHEGPAILSHEFMCGADAAAARRLVEDLAPAEVHVVLTARDALGMLTAGWAEYVKNGGTQPLADMGEDGPPGQPEFSWRTWDLAGVLRRWGPVTDARRVHVIPLPGRDAPPDELWRRYASVLGLDAERYPAPAQARNPALGVAQIELLRRVNPHLGDFGKAVDRGTWIRGYLAEDLLARQPGPRLGADPEQVADARERAAAAVALIAEQGYDVVGDLDRLRIPDEVEDAPRPDTLPAEDLVDVATRLVAVMLGEIRRAQSSDPASTSSGRGRRLRMGRRRSLG